MHSEGRATQNEKMSNETNFRRSKNKHKLSFNKELRKRSHLLDRKNETNLVRAHPLACGQTVEGQLPQSEI